MFNNKLFEWVHINVRDPLKTWWKARKYFKRPKITAKIHKVYTFRGYPYATYHRLGKILDIYIHDVCWKDKFDTPRHERNPLIFICLFRKIALTVFFNIKYYDEFGEKQNGDMEYWEYLLTWLYYKNKRTLKCYSSWTVNSQLYKTVKWGKAEDGSEDEHIPITYTLPCVAMSLNKRGIKELKRELNEERGHTPSY